MRVTSEGVAVAASVVGIVGSLAWPFAQEMSAAHPGEATVVTLTGVATTGTWTDRKVTGSNYWIENFPPSRPVFEANEPAVLRLKSADVIHSFYCPGLGIGPVEVHPGRLVTVEFVPVEAGVFEYYCTTVCGDPHYAMRGEILVVAANEARPDQLAPPVDRYWEDLPPTGDTAVERGRWLFRRWGCGTCHGADGEGGVANFNYPGGFVTPINTLAEKIELFEPEEVDVFIGALEAGVKPGEIPASEFPPDGDLEAAVSRYEETVSLIKLGREVTRRDPDRPAPPLSMPGWGTLLSDRDIDAIVAYLLSLQPWEEDVWEDDE